MSRAHAPASHEARLNELEAARVVHDRQIADHDEVLKDLRDHLATLVTRLGAVEKKLTIIAVLAIGGDKVPQILQALGLH